MSTYRFWGIHSDGTRDLFGMATNVAGMDEALDVLAMIPREGIAYTGFEIIRDGSRDEALSKLPKLRKR